MYVPRRRHRQWIQVPNRLPSAIALQAIQECFQVKYECINRVYSMRRTGIWQQDQQSICLEYACYVTWTSQWRILVPGAGTGMYLSYDIIFHMTGIGQVYVVHTNQIVIWQGYARNVPENQFLGIPDAYCTGTTVTARGAGPVCFWAGPSNCLGQQSKTSKEEMFTSNRWPQYQPSLPKQMTNLR